jgi:fatty acid desaturase
MVPVVDLLPDTLPTDRLTATGMPKPELRAELRKIDDVRNIGTVLLPWVQAAITIGLAIWIGNPIGYLVAIIFMGPVFARFAIVGHEAAHKLLFTNKRLNDVVGRWLIAYPAFVPLEVYRRGHFAHHRDEFGPDEPDMNLYVGYPITRRSFARKLLRDAVGISGWKNLKPLLTSMISGSTRKIALKILLAQVVIFAVFAVIGHPLLYLVLWLVPWMTSWRVLNRLRAIAEHGGMQRSDDRRETTHHVEQSWFANFWLVPLNTGWHLAHHVDMGVPWRRLPDLHAELVAAGWVTSEIRYPNYRSLWKALMARPADGVPAERS